MSQLYVVRFYVSGVHELCVSNPKTLLYIISSLDEDKGVNWWKIEGYRPSSFGWPNEGWNKLRD